MASIVKIDGVYKATKISGPKHNFLGLAVVESRPAVLRIARRQLRDDDPPLIDEMLLLSAVFEGVFKGNSASGRSLFVEYLEYVQSDTPDYEAYVELATAIVQSASCDSN